MQRAALILATLVPTLAFAMPFSAQVTEVADAADKDNVFDFNASVGFRRSVKQVRITREGLVNGAFAQIEGLKFTQTTQALDIRASIGLFHDLELNFYLPYTFNSDSVWTHPDGVDGTTSIVTNDQSLGSALFPIDYKTSQRGLSTLDVGLSFSPLNDSRDDTKPTLTLRFTYGIPIASAYLRNDNNGSDLNNPANLGDKIHRLKFDLAFSKRFGAAEPYFALNYVLPIADGAALAGIAPAQTGGFITGFELIPWDSPKDRQRLSFDIRAGVQYVGPGRTYSELSGPLQRLTYVDNYTSLSVGAHLVFQPVEYVRLTSGVTFAHDTNHWLTNESPGTSNRPDGVVDLNDPTQANPFYNAVVDGVGHRFKAEDTTIFTWYVALGLML